jgi:Holliday junction DNA helicase RuvB
MNSPNSSESFSAAPRCWRLRSTSRARRVRDFAQVRAGGVITGPVADAALAREGVDALGLDRLDRAYLTTIAVQYGGGPVGINAVAATLTEDVETLEDVVEPYLLKTGFVQRTASGRKITASALAHLDLAGPRTDAARQERLF